MNSNPFAALFEFLKTDASWMLSTWYSVITRGARAFDGLDMSHPSTILLSFRFLTYIGLFTFLIDVPVAALLKLPYDKPAYAMTAILLNLVLWIGYASALHLGMKAFGGAAEFRESIVIFCFSTAFYIPILVLQWPTQPHIVPMLASGKMAQSEYIERLPKDEALAFSLLSLLSTALLIYFFVVVISALRKRHGLDEEKGLLAGLAGVLGVVGIVAYISFPMHKILYTAFK